MSVQMLQQDISRVLIIGGGPAGLFIGCLLQDQNVHVTIVEKRLENTRTRCVKLLGQMLLSDTIMDDIYLFSEQQIRERQNAVELMKLELSTMVIGWLDLCTPILTIQEELTTYFTSSGGTILVGEQYDFSKNLDLLQHYSNTLIIDCTGYHSVLSKEIQPDNRINRFVEHVLMWTFIFDDRYECNELCKYYKNRNTQRFRVIPSIDDTYMTGDRQTHITCLITINENIFNQVSTINLLTYNYLKEHQREIYDDLNMFLNNLSSNDMSKIHFDTMELVALPLNVYRAKKMTHMNGNNLNQPWVLMGDAAMSAPYFQSISKGYEAAIYFAYLFRHMNGNVEQMMTKYEDYMEKLWLTIQKRSKEIQRNKQILEAICADDREAILKIIRIY